MKKYAGYLITAASALIPGLYLVLATTGYRYLGYLLLAVAGLALVFLGLRALGERHPKAARILRTVVIAGMVLFFTAVAVTISVIVAGSVESDNSGADYAIVLGAGTIGTEPSAPLLARLEAALQYAEENPETVIIVSGCQGDREIISEAQCMRDWLTARGVSAERIIMEEWAESTEENIALSRAIILRREPNFRGRVCVISETYHVARGKMYARRAGFNDVVSASGASENAVMTANYYLREVCAMWYFAVFER